MNTPRWFVDAISEGLSMLVVLSLPGTPSHETIEYTQSVWIDAIYTSSPDWHPRRDINRLRKAFQNLARTCDRWPAPKLLIDKLTPPPGRDRLSRPWAEGERERNHERMAALIASVNIRTPGGKQ